MKIRLFLAIPENAAAERAIALQVVARLAAGQPDDPFEIVDWPHHLRQHQDTAGHAEAAAIEARDVFLGVAWSSFDSAPEDGGAVPPAGRAGERDFELAYLTWQRAAPKRGFFIRSLRPPESLEQISGRELESIELFFAKAARSVGPAVHRAPSLPELEKQLEAVLGPFAATVQHHPATRPQPVAGSPVDTAPVDTAFADTTPADAGPVAAAAVATAAAATAPVAKAPVAKAPVAKAPIDPTPVDTTPVAAPLSTPTFAHELELGKAYEVTFLSITVANSDEIARRHLAEEGSFERTLAALRKMVGDTARSYGGDIFQWTEAGALLLFWRPGGPDHAVMTGLKVLHNLPIFNLDTRQNPLGESLHVRIASQDAVIVYRWPTDQITAPGLHFVKRLQDQYTTPDELCLPRHLLDSLDARLRQHFQFKGRFEREAIFTCRLPAAANAPAERGDLEEIVAKMKNQAAAISEIAASPAAAGEDSDTLGAAVAEAYALLNRFCASFSRVDPSWEPEALIQLADAAAALSQQEADLWRLLRELSARQDAADLGQLETVVRAAARRRARPVVILDKLAERCRSLARREDDSSQAGEQHVDAALIEKVEALLRADALDTETALTDLLLNRKNGFLEFLAQHRDDHRYPALLQKLWKSADLIVLDDLYSIREYKRAGEKKVLEALTADPRFAALGQLLASTAAIDQQQMDAALGAHGGASAISDEDRQIIWRCLVLGHTSPELRAQMAFQLTPYSMWQTVSHPSIPLPTLYAIANKVNRSGDNDARRIFYDCTRERIDALVDEARTKNDLAEIAKLVLLLLDFPFLVESGYFETFDDILQKFLSRAQKAGLVVAYFENYRQTLEKASQKVGDKEPSGPPAGIQKLPLTLQRRLAGEARYLSWFVTHPDPRIAGETRRHIGLTNVERVLRLREINAAVLQDLLRRPELFTRTQPILAALNHPKCTQSFASRYIAGMSRNRAGQKALEQIVNNPSANPVVRAMARQATAQRKTSAR